MKVIVTKNYDESCAVVANLCKELLADKPNAKLGLATGSTPLPVYEKLIAMHRAGEVDFAKVHTVNLDEYCGLEGTHPQSYRYFMDTHFFNHVNIDKANTFVASGMGDCAANARVLDAKVYEGGTPDLQLLGVGNNGHIAFNEAGDALTASAHVEQLTPSTIDANARFFESRADVPTKAITMGVANVLAAKQVVLLATGKSKAQALKGLLLEDVVTTQNPATLLKLHPNTVVVIDTDLADAIGFAQS